VRSPASVSGSAIAHAGVHEEGFAIRTHSGSPRFTRTDQASRPDEDVPILLRGGVEPHDGGIACRVQPELLGLLDWIAREVDDDPDWVSVKP
jgi:hypothetical protein